MRSSGITLEVTKKSKDDVLDAEAEGQGVKGEDQGNSVLVGSERREREEAELRDIEELRVRDPSMTARGKPHSLKNEDVSDVLVWKASF